MLQQVGTEHYEKALEDYLRAHALPYLRVDQIKRSAFAEVRLKSFDLVIYREQGENILVDVKGRKWPYPGKNGKRYWENWVTADDLDGLARWEEVFGPGFKAAFVFCYWLTGADSLRWDSPVRRGKIRISAGMAGGLQG